MPEQLPLTNKLSLSTRKTTNYRWLSAQFGDGYQQRAADGLNFEVDQWIIVYTLLSPAESIIIDNFLALVNTGNFFLFTPENEIEKKWVMSSADPINKTHTGGIHVNISFTIIQVFDLG